MAWDSFKRIRFRKKKEMPEGLWMRCPDCENMQYKKAVEELLQVCPECNHHFEISVARRIEQLVDEGTFEEVETDLSSTDPLKFVAVKAYADRLVRAKKATGLEEACVVGRGKISGHDVVFGVTAFSNPLRSPESTNFTFTPSFLNV